MDIAESPIPISGEPSAAAPPPPPATPGREGRGAGRQAIEFVACLGILVIVLRTFTAEAYVVPTGSMAPTLLGIHRESTCGNCEFRFAVGLDADRPPARAICPNCGRIQWDRTQIVECPGDRLLVQKHLFEFRRPRRWEVAVFQSPLEPTQPYVKRIVGLPGESVRLVAGEVLIDGKIARKSFEEQRATRVLVHDSDFPAKDSRAFPRWGPHKGNPRYPLKSGWSAEGKALVHARTQDETSLSSLVPDWIEYRHWQPERGTYGAILDFYAYNGGEVRSECEVNDLAVEAEVEAGLGVEAILVRINGTAGRHQVRLPVSSDAPLEVLRNGKPRKASGIATDLASAFGAPGRVHKLAVTTIDRRLEVRLDGKPLFDPIEDEEPPGLGAPPPGSPLAFGVIGNGKVRISSVRLYRDLYYTDRASNLLRRPFAVGEPYQLSVGEYFVLGDNSPVSNDSRFWPKGPVVRDRDLLGKPFLVHLPSTMVPLKVWGRATYWIPDPREIRYIR